MEMYGQRCEYICPECQNTGECHPLTGKCICPPQYHGEFCEKRKILLTLKYFIIYIKNSEYFALKIFL